MERTTKTKVLRLMELIVPDLPKIDDHTLLNDIGFDLFHREMLLYDLENTFAISIPDLEINQWQTFADIIETVRCYQH